jgi:hypothetical protein
MGRSHRSRHPHGPGLGSTAEVRSITQALSAAIASAAKLPPEEQDALAAILLVEISSEERWSSLFEGSQTLLEQLAEEAIRDFEAPSQLRAGLFDRKGKSPGLRMDATEVSMSGSGQ